MKVKQVVEAGEVKTFYMSSWSDNQVELTVEGGEISIRLPDKVMKRMHKEFGERLADLAEKRLTEAKEMVESTQEDSDE